MNKELPRELHDPNIPLLNKFQLKFLENVEYVIHNKILPERSVDLPDDEEELFEMKCQVSAMEENLKIIIGRLKGGRSTRKCIIQIYSKWRKAREESIEKLKEIADSINTHMHNCKISKVVGYCTAIAGGTLTLASSALIPFTLGMTTPLVMAGGSMTLAGFSTAVGTNITKDVLLKTNMSKAKEIINEDGKYLEEMNECLKHAAELEKALAEVLSIEIVNDIAERVKTFVKRASNIQNDTKRMKEIETNLNEILDSLPGQLLEAVHVIAVVTLVVILVTTYLLLLNTENRIVFDYSALTIRRVVEIASLFDNSLAVVSLARLFSVGAVVLQKLQKDPPKDVTQGSVAVSGMALDVAGIALTSVDVDKGCLSPEAKKIAEAAEALKKEAEIMDEVYGNFSRCFELEIRLLDER